MKLSKICIVNCIILLLSSLTSYANTCIVEKVVDGDTLWCTFEDRSTKIRLLAVDAPENTFGKNECYGEEVTFPPNFYPTANESL